MEDKSWASGREGGRVLVEAGLHRPEPCRRGNLAQGWAKGDTRGREEEMQPASCCLSAGSALQQASLPLAHHHPPTLFYLRV